MTYPRASSLAAFVVTVLCVAGFGCTDGHSPLAGLQFGKSELPVAADAPQKVASSNAANKTVYLTFDADMTPSMKKRLEEKKVRAWYDPALIAYLRQEDVHATIFVTGMFAETYQSLIAGLAKDDRFSLQNHSYDHSGFEFPCYGLNELKTDDQRRAEVSETQSILTRLTGKAPTLFRYPGLCKNAHDDAIVTSQGLRINDGNLVSGDAFNRNADGIARRVISSAKDGSVVVMHLGGPNAPATTDALRKIVPALRAEGFAFSTLQ